MSSRNVIARHWTASVRSSHVVAAAPAASSNAGTVGRQAVDSAAASRLTLIAGVPALMVEPQRKASVLSDAMGACAPSAIASKKSNSHSTLRRAASPGFCTFR